ncbi:hypothetical protein IVA87_07160 [Bradyrhizobium sp. 147]|uniref:hypothetical protein n=1 Tax=unclassified Bradyrhizobium TaxID=2631580 RepID=UPI001FFBE5D1|nr:MULTISPECIES: hypothetical protein [unclassified Bradyrhizobium]MCK1594109.1 hypothetical protein [Bradyrhizobium sp. 164]MCK1679254.1 hypothetical protein [Bradyrhizobium sp. 147]
MTKLVELTTARENQSLAGILGCWLESRREDLFVDDEMLKDFETVGTVVAARGARHDVPGRRGASGMERGAA